MAEKFIRIVTSDLSGEEGAETVSISLDGTEYAIDLTTKEREKLDRALNPFLKVARKASTAKKATAKKTTKASGGPSAAEIREWAAKQGLEAGQMGRVPKAVREAYEAAH